ncbi:unnamed protein product [Rotaria sp. Silwood2]|nr:unnamed protein product [Rotaria sp. Silwood2]CAF4681221.1 unnamed protein product [Rotaria sp. Silwood2]
MFVSSHSIRYLFQNLYKEINRRQLFIQRGCLQPYKTGLNLVRSLNQLNVLFDHSKSNDNQEDLGSFRNFNISEQTQKRLKGFLVFF